MAIQCPGVFFIGSAFAQGATLEEAIQAGFTKVGQLQTDSELASLKGDPRFQRLTPKSLSDEVLFVERVRIIQKWTIEAAGDQFGWTARRVGDLDRDSIADFISTAPTYKCGAGKVYVYSSKTSANVPTSTTTGHQKFWSARWREMERSINAAESLWLLKNRPEVCSNGAARKQGDCSGIAAAVKQIEDQVFLLAVGAQEAGPTKCGFPIALAGHQARSKSINSA